MTRLTAILAAGALTLAAGCGSGIEYATVTGRVTDKAGRPMKDIVVRFAPVPEEGQPERGPGASAVTDADGRYELRSYVRGEVAGEGAVVGRHKVICDDADPPFVSQADYLKGKRVPLKFDPQYGQWESTPLEFTVEAGEDNVFDIELPPPPRRR